MKDKYLDDLQEIRDIMQRSSRFISLSGLSGVSAGMIGLGGTYWAYETIFRSHELLNFKQHVLKANEFGHLVVMALVIFGAASGFAVFFSRNRSQKKGHTFDALSKRLLLNLLIPLLAGGLFCLILLLNGLIGILPALSLLIYGLALVNGSKYTLNEIRSLGIIEAGLGILALIFIEYSLWFWAFGFGIMHIIYGLIVHRKYRS
jgi:hypothetical protein